MKSFNTILNIVLIIAVGVLFYLYFSVKGENPTTKTNTEKTEQQTDTSTNNNALKFAYVNVDTLLSQYLLFDELQNKLLDKQKKMESELNKKMEAFQKDAAEFQKKVQTNSFLSMESAQAQQQQLQEKQQKLLALRDKLTQEIMAEKQQLENQLLDSVIIFLKEFNKTQKYNYIFNANAFLIGDTAQDITDTVVVLLNERYKRANTKK